LDGSTPDAFDTIAVNLTGSIECWTIISEPTPVGESGDFVIANFGELNCEVCNIVYPCPTPTPTVTPTRTLTPTPTPTNIEFKVYLQSCCNETQYYAITYNASQQSQIPPGGTWVVNGQTNLTNICYKIVEEPGDYVNVGPLNGEFTGQEGVPYTEDGVQYDDCDGCILAGNSCKSQPTPSPTPTNSVTPTRTPTPSVSPSRTPTRTPTPTVTRTPTRTPTPTVTPTKSSCPVSQYNHQVIACQVGAADCTKTTGFIKVNGTSVFSWSTAAVTQSGNIQINPGDVVQLQMVAIDNTPTCVNGGIPFSDVAGTIRIGGPSGTIIYNQNTCSPSCSGGSGILDTTFTATTCNYYFQLQSACS
jgi:hypothetical protein